MAPCKYAKCAEPLKPGSDQLFTSPVYFGSKLGKYTGTVNKQTAMERQGYALTTRFNSAIKDKESLIKFIQRRELLRGSSSYYGSQIEQLKKEIDDIKKQRDYAEQRNQHIMDILVNNAGRMVPIGLFQYTMPTNQPVQPEGIVGEQPQPTAIPEESETEESETEESKTEEHTPERGEESETEEYAPVPYTQ